MTTPVKPKPAPDTIHDIKLALVEMAGEQKLTNQKIDHLTEILSKDVDGVKSDVATLRRELDEVKKSKVSLDRFQWVERAAYAALAGIVGAWIKLTTGA